MASGHWITEMGNEIRDRASLRIDQIVAGMPASPAPAAIEEEKQPSIEEFLTADPQQRQAILTSVPNTSKYISGLMGEANARWGAMAAKIMPALQMEELSYMGDPIGGFDSNLGVAAAHADLTDLLGFDPFAP